MPFAHGGAGGAGTLLLRVMKRRYVLLVLRGVQYPRSTTVRGMQRESAASPLPRECCSTTHILQSFLRQYLNELLRKTGCRGVSD